MAQVVKTSVADINLTRLREMREYGGAALTTGLTDNVIQDFLDDGYRDLAIAIERGHERFLDLQQSHADFLAL